MGVESTFSIGIGTPLDFKGRSHHFLQALGSIGGGFDGRTASGMVVAGADLDYIYWAEPRLDVRAGAHFSYVQPAKDGSEKLYGAGAHIGILPALVQLESSWMAPQLVLGPEFRLTYLWSDPPGAARTLFSLPLVAELNLLAAGD